MSICCLVIFFVVVACGGNSVVCIDCWTHESTSQHIDDEEENFTALAVTRADTFCKRFIDSNEPVYLYAAGGIY